MSKHLNLESTYNIIIEQCPKRLKIWTSNYQCVTSYHVIRITNLLALGAKRLVIGASVQSLSTVYPKILDVQSKSSPTAILKV